MAAIRAYVGLGANLDRPAWQLERALEHLQRLGNVAAVSRFYRSAPLGPGVQPDYCNAACALDVALEPEALLQVLLRIERAAGRVRDGRKWQPRPLDLDLLHVPGVEMQTAHLQLPHPGIASRSFVLVPLDEVAPGLEVPGVGSIAQAAAAIDRCGLRPWAD